MRVLVIEDEEHVSQALVDAMMTLRPPVEAVVAQSRTSGVDALVAGEFDFIICDLRLPPNDGGLDTDESHGLAVHSKAREVCPGTPCLFFTGFDTSSAVLDQLSGSGAQDVLGTGTNYGMTQLLKKDRFLECIERIADFNIQLQALETITIEMADPSVSLDEVEERTLRLAARLRDGKVVEATPMGGLSGARTLRTRISDDSGRVLATYFVKIGSREQIQEESANYDSYVGSLLTLGTHPARVHQIDAGIRKRKALLYQIAGDYSLSLFELLDSDEPAAITIVDAVRGILAPWDAFHERSSIEIGVLRSKRITDAEMTRFKEDLSSAQSFENMQMDVTTSYQHGDLHGFNILCNSAGTPLVVDFGNVARAPSCTDPILLELSVLFHAESPFRGAGWPTPSQAEAWFDLDDYLRGCPIPLFIKKCRSWAVEAGVPADLPPVVYSEAVRQLKYKDTDHQLALAIARSAIQEALEGPAARY